MKNVMNKISRYVYYMIYTKDDRSWRVDVKELEKLVQDMIFQYYSLDRIDHIDKVTVIYNNILQPPTKTSEKEDVTSEFKKEMKNMRRKLEKIRRGEIKTVFIEHGGSS